MSISTISHAFLQRRACLLFLLLVLVAAAHSSEVEDMRTHHCQSEGSNDDPPNDCESDGSSTGQESSSSAFSVSRANGEVVIIMGINEELYEASEDFIRASCERRTVTLGRLWRQLRQLSPGRLWRQLRQLCLRVRAHLDWLWTAKGKMEAWELSNQAIPEMNRADDPWFATHPATPTQKRERREQPWRR